MLFIFRFFFRLTAGIHHASKVQCVERVARVCCGFRSAYHHVMRGKALRRTKAAQPGPSTLPSRIHLRYVLDPGCGFKNQPMCAPKIGPRISVERQAIRFPCHGACLPLLGDIVRSPSRANQVSLLRCRLSSFTYVLFPRAAEPLS